MTPCRSLPPKWILPPPITAELAPEPLTVLTPLDGTQSVESLPVFRWTAHPKATKYRLIIKRNGKVKFSIKLNSKRICFDGICTADSAVLRGFKHLKAGKLYKWQVVAFVKAKRFKTQFQRFRIVEPDGICSGPETQTCITQVPTRTNTPRPATAIRTNTPRPPTSTNVPQPTATKTKTRTPTKTYTRTATRVVTATVTFTPSPTSTRRPCTGICVPTPPNCDMSTSGENTGDATAVYSPECEPPATETETPYPTPTDGFCQFIADQPDVVICPPTETPTYTWTPRITRTPEPATAVPTNTPVPLTATPTPAPEVRVRRPNDPLPTPDVEEDMCIEGDKSSAARNDCAEQAYDDWYNQLSSTRTPVLRDIFAIAFSLELGNERYFAQAHEVFGNYFVNVCGNGVGCNRSELMNWLGGTDVAIYGRVNGQADVAGMTFIYNPLASEYNGIADEILNANWAGQCVANPDTPCYWGNWAFGTEDYKSIREQTDPTHFCKLYQVWYDWDEDVQLDPHPTDSWTDYMFAIVTYSQNEDIGDTSIYYPPNPTPPWLNIPSKREARRNNYNNAAPCPGTED